MGYIYAVFNGALGCYRASDGTTYWELPVSRFQSYIANSSFPVLGSSFGPVGPTSDKYVFVADDFNSDVGDPAGAHVWAITKGSSGGKIAWATAVTNKTDYWSGGPAALANGILYLGEFASNDPPTGHMNAFNATTGQLLWSTLIGGVSTYATTVVDGVVYTNTCPGWDVPGGAIIALDAISGATLWRFNTTGIPMSNPIIYKNSLYQAVYLDDQLYCIDKDTGSLQWSMDSPGGGRGMTIADGLLYGTAYGDILANGTYNNGYFYCLDPNTNTIVWKYYLDNTPFSTNNGAYSRGFPVADGIAYGSDLTGTFYAFGKGPTTTEMSVTAANIAQGTSIAIYGKVYDESPASQGVPVANSQVELLAQKMGETNWSDIGKATTDSLGQFVSQWAPQSEGTFTVMAKFDGTKDYGWSSSNTIVQVNAVQPTPTSAVTPAPTATSTTTMDLLIIAVAVVMVLVIANTTLLVRKLKKQN
jgi:outer membrane protein assembly factor BamB